MKIFNSSLISVFLLFIISSIVFVILALIGGYISLDCKLIMGCISYFIGMLLVLRNSNFPNKVFAFSLVFFLPFFLFCYFNIFQFKDTWVSFASSLFMCMGAVGGLFFYKIRSLLIPFTLLMLVLSWFVFFKKPFVNKNTYNTYDGSVLFKYPNVKISDSTVAIYTFSDPLKIYILDFWTSSCGVCFRKFPIVDSINKLADKSRVEIIAVNIPIRKEKKEDNYAILNEFDYGFKKLFTESISTADSFGVEGYPTTIVLQNQQVIFRGDFEDAVKRFKVVQ